MFERLEAIKVRYEQLTEELSKPEVLGDYNQLKKLSKEQKDLEETYVKYKEYQKVINNIEEAQMLINDPEMGEMAKLELEEASSKKETLLSELEILLIPKDENDDKDIIMEIRGAAGGDEANIFAGDLFRMYSRYADKVGWKIEVINSEAGTAGGFSQIEAKIKGENVSTFSFADVMQQISFAKFGQFCNQFAFGWVLVFDEKYHVVECLARSAQQAHYHLHTTVAIALTFHHRIQSLLFRGHHIVSVFQMFLQR